VGIDCIIPVIFENMLISPNECSGRGLRCEMIQQLTKTTCAGPNVIRVMWLTRRMADLGRNTKQVMESQLIVRDVKITFIRLD
jgi:hypothetical protein